MYERFGKLVNEANSILLVVANNPDGDSVGTTLALEEIFADLKKDVWLYCKTQIPLYLRFLDGWDRFVNVLPNKHDLGVMVDNGSMNLLHNSQIPDLVRRLQSKPFVILDHHQSQSNIDFALVYNDPKASASGQLVYDVAQKLQWSINTQAARHLTSAILSDTLNFCSENMQGNSQPLRIVADLVDQGVDLASLNRKRLEYKHIEPEWVAMKGMLLSHIHFLDNQRIACLVITTDEIKRISPFFNPSTILDEMHLVKGIKLSLGFKQYTDTQGVLKKITLRIRCHHGCRVARKLAESFGGGGHFYAAGVQWVGPDMDFQKIKQEVIDLAIQLLDEDAIQGEHAA